MVEARRKAGRRAETRLKRTILSNIGKQWVMRAPVSVMRLTWEIDVIVTPGNRCHSIDACVSYPYVLSARAGGKPRHSPPLSATAHPLPVIRNPYPVAVLLRSITDYISSIKVLTDEALCPARPASPSRHCAQANLNTVIFLHAQKFRFFFLSSSFSSVSTNLGMMSPLRQHIWSSASAGAC